jgi:hypothetical protein
VFDPSAPQPAINPTLDALLKALAEAGAGVANELLASMTEEDRRDAEAVLQARTARLRLVLTLAPALQIVGLLQNADGSTRQLVAWTAELHTEPEPLAN